MAEQISDECIPIQLGRRIPVLDRYIFRQESQRGIIVDHKTGLFLRDGRLQHHPSRSSGTRFFTPSPGAATS